MGTACPGPRTQASSLHSTSPPCTWRLEHPTHSKVSPSQSPQERAANPSGAGPRALEAETARQSLLLCVCSLETPQ